MNFTITFLRDDISFHNTNKEKYNDKSNKHTVRSRQ